MMMRILSADSKNDLVRHEASIEALFQECFEDRMSSELWRWAYLENPHGEPFVSLCYDGDRLVGHYAMIPMPLRSAAARVNSYLSMTTMVATSHRMHGLFVQLAAATYARALSKDVDFVMGFPNSQSAPGFRKKLGWSLPPTDFVVSLTKNHLIEVAEQGALVDCSNFSLDLRHSSTRLWRLGRPGAIYEWHDGLVFKSYGDAVDLLSFESPEQLSDLPDDKKIKLLVPASCIALEDHRLFDYQFGGYSLASTFDSAQINRQMIISDVF